MLGRGQDAASAPLSHGAVCLRVSSSWCPATPPGHVLRLGGHPRLCGSRCGPCLPPRPSRLCRISPWPTSHWEFSLGPSPAPCHAMGSQPCVY